MNRLKFAKAARLLRLIVQHIETSSLADLQQEDLGNVQRVRPVLENVRPQPWKKRNSVSPAPGMIHPSPQPQSRHERIVRAVLDRIHQDYAQPLTLLKCADDLRMNAAYLCHRFSQVVGLPFKACLTNVRIEKAWELLNDPTKNISEVASAVGYASQKCFRSAFKKATGLSPRLWREMCR